MPSFSHLSYRVAKIHGVPYNIGHFLQMSLQLLVKLAENDLYHNESDESSPPCTQDEICNILFNMNTRNMSIAYRSIVVTRHK